MFKWQTKKNLSSWTLPNFLRTLFPNYFLPDYQWTISPISLQFVTALNDRKKAPFRTFFQRRSLSKEKGRCVYHTMQLGFNGLWLCLYLSATCVSSSRYRHGRLHFLAKGLKGISSVNPVEGFPCLKQESRPVHGTWSRQGMKRNLQFKWIYECIRNY